MTPKPSKNIVIVAGEASGDLHAADLVKSTLTINPDIKFSGIGGEMMRQAGVDIIVDIADLSVLGIVEVIKNLSVIRRTMRKIREHLKKNPPDLLILVDFSGFNLRLAKFAKKLNIKILYFISPHVMVWRKYRIKTIRRCVDKMAVIFPFEVDFYRQHQVPVSYVGNPLVSSAKPTLSREIFYTIFGCDPNKKIIGLFPGSRKSEIETILPTLIETAKLLEKKYPDSQFIIPLASTLNNELLIPYFKDVHLNIKIIPDQLYNIISVCNAIIAVSGTVSLEIALIGTPMVIVYKLSPLTFSIGRLFIKVEHIGMPNIIAGKTIVKELIQHQATPNAIYDEITKILGDEQYNKNMRDQLATIKNKMQDDNKENIGDIVVGMLLPDE